MTNSKQWKRKGFVKIIPSNGNVWSTIDNGAELDFSFDIKKPLAAVCQCANIVIYGMNWDNIQAYSSWTAEELAKGLDNRIEVHVGYGSETTCIFAGTICYAMPTMPPNRELRIQARSGYYRNCSYINGDSSDPSGTPSEDELVSYQDWFTDVMGMMNAKIDFSKYRPSKNYNNEITKPSLPPGSTYDTLFKLAYEQARQLHPPAYLVEDAPDSDGKINFFLINETILEDSDNPVLVSQDTGMIGLPTIKYLDVEFTTLLNTSIARGKFVNIESKFTPNFSFLLAKGRDGVSKYTVDKFRVYEVHYKGRLRGDEWYSTFKAKFVGVI